MTDQLNVKGCAVCEQLLDAWLQQVRRENDPLEARKHPLRDPLLTQADLEVVARMRLKEHILNCRACLLIRQEAGLIGAADRVGDVIDEIKAPPR